MSVFVAHVVKGSNAPFVYGVYSSRSSAIDFLEADFGMRFRISTQGSVTTLYDGRTTSDSFLVIDLYLLDVE